MMKKKEKLSTEEKEMVDEIESYMEEVDSQPDVAESPLPPELQAKIHQQIETRALAREKAEQERMSKEERELIRLGKIYRKRRKARKYVVLAAALVAVLALGITSIGGPEKIFETFEREVLGRERTGLDTDDSNEFVESVSEEEAYQRIEDEFGFLAVRMHYLPKEIKFLKAKTGGEIQGIEMFYGKDENVRIFYFIQPNYRMGSYGIDIEDEVIEEYSLGNGDLQILVKRYLVAEGNDNRWSGEFSYKNVHYSIMGIDMERDEFEKILKNLYFS